jgi:hypothetical protein
LAIHAKGGESISRKQKDRTTTNFKNEVFKLYLIVFKKGRSSKIGKTLLNTKRSISLRGSFVLVKGKAFETGEKISNLENAYFNLIHVSLTICKRILKRIFKNKTCGASMVQNFK